MPRNSRRNSGSGSCTTVCAKQRDEAFEGGAHIILLVTGPFRKHLIDYGTRETTLEPHPVESVLPIVRPSVVPGFRCGEDVIHRDVACLA